MIMLAVAVGAGASNAAGYSTTTTVICGLARFSMAVWSSSKCRKVRFLLGCFMPALLAFLSWHCLEAICLLVIAYPCG